MRAVEGSGFDGLPHTGSRNYLGQRRVAPASKAVDHLQAIAKHHGGVGVVGDLSDQVTLRRHAVLVLIDDQVMDFQLRIVKAAYKLAG
ncbi:hypothetical protein D3C87_1358620 [compost metagenome]